MFVVSRVRVLLLTVVLIMLSLSVYSVEVFAEPVLFRRARNSFSLGVEVFEPLLGEFGRNAGLGMGLSGQMGWQAGYWGGILRISAGRGMSSSKSLVVYDKGYQRVLFQLGARFYYPPFRRYLLSFFVEGSGSFMMLSSNSLVELSKGREVLWGTGGRLGIQWIVGALILEAYSDVQWMWQIKSLMVGGGISVGFGTVL